MSGVVPRPPPSQDDPLLHRQNSISAATMVVPTKLHLLPHHSSSSTTSSTTSSSSGDMELLSIKPTSYSYTSLKDLLPSAAVNTPRSSSAPFCHPGSDICIRNRLVKQAAWAYLQPMSTSPGSAGGNFFNRLWPRIAAFVRHSFIRVLDWTIRFIRISI